MQLDYYHRSAAILQMKNGKEEPVAPAGNFQMRRIGSPCVPDLESMLSLAYLLKSDEIPSGWEKLRILGLLLSNALTNMRNSKILQ